MALDKTRAFIPQAGQDLRSALFNIHKRSHRHALAETQLNANNNDVTRAVKTSQNKNMAAVLTSHAPHGVYFIWTLQTGAQRPA